MLVRNPFFWIAAALGLIMAIWYRGQVYSEPPVPESSTVVFVTGGSGPFWQITANGAKAAAKELNVDLKVEMPSDESVAEQVEILSRLKSVDPDGIAISPLDAERQTSIINQLTAETNVITFDADAPLSQRQCYVGTSNYAAGGLCAQLVHEAIPDGGKVAVLLANETKSNLIDRKLGFEDSIHQPAEAAEGEESDEAEEMYREKYPVIGYLVDEGDSEKTAQNIREALSEHPDLACFVAMNARHGPILLEVLEEESKLGEVKLITFDERDEVLQGIADGNVFATIAQDPYQYGYEAVRMLSSLHKGESALIPIVGKGSILIAAEAIRQDSLDDFRKRLESRLQATQPAEPKKAA